MSLQHRARKAMQAYQERQLIRQVQDVYKGNEIHRRLWDEADFNLKQFRGSEDMVMLPLVTKQQMRELRETLPDKLPGGTQLVRQFQLIQDDPEVIKLRTAPLRRPAAAVLADLTDRLAGLTAGTAVRIELVDEMELGQSGKFHLCQCSL